MATDIKILQEQVKKLDGAIANLKLSIEQISIKVTELAANSDKLTVNSNQLITMMKTDAESIASVISSYRSLRKRLDILPRQIKRMAEIKK